MLWNLILALYKNAFWFFYQERKRGGGGGEQITTHRHEIVGDYHKDEKESYELVPMHSEEILSKDLS